VSKPLLPNKERTFQSAEAKDDAISDSTTAADRNARQENLTPSCRCANFALRKVNFIKRVPTEVLLLALLEPAKRREQ